MPIPVLLMPPLIMGTMKKLNLFPKTPRLATVAELAVVFCCLQIGLPTAIALFPSKLEMNVSELEPEFQSLEDEGIHTVYANKGL